MKTSKIKNRLIFFTLINICFLTFVVRSYAYDVPAIEGKITDATTNKPIENVIVEARWLKTTVMSSSEEIDSEIVATKKDGIYRIPQKTTFHLISGFAYLDLTIRHPLYETKKLSWLRCQFDYLRWDKKEGVVNLPDGIPEAKGTYKDGVISFDMPVLSLKEKYKEGAEPREVVELGSEFLHKAPSYFLAGKKMGLKMNYLEVFKAWDEIAERFKNNEGLLHSLKHGKKRVNWVFEGGDYD